MQRIRILKLFFFLFFLFSSLPENAMEGIRHLTFTLFKNIGHFYVGKVISYHKAFISYHFYIFSIFLQFYLFENCTHVYNMSCSNPYSHPVSPPSLLSLFSDVVCFFKHESTWCSLYASQYSTTYKETDMSYKGTMRFQQPFSRLGGIFISACCIHTGFWAVLI